MATITFNTTHNKSQLREQLDAVVAVCREMLDGVVSNWMRRAAAEAEYVRPRPGTSSQPTDLR
jgi:Glu-tRNA(Gln) amidotransferase subunit E-like FAD-binding protein